MQLIPPSNLTKTLETSSIKIKGVHGNKRGETHMKKLVVILMNTIEE